MKLTCPSCGDINNAEPTMSAEEMIKIVNENYRSKL